MGGMLSHPVTNKSTDSGEGLGLRYGLSSMQGWRSEMEDAHDIQVGLRYGLEDWSFFAVFDGHAGKRAAAFAAWNLLEYILRDSHFELETESHPEHMYIEPDLDNMSDPNRNGVKHPVPISVHPKTTSDSEALKNFLDIMDIMSSRPINVGEETRPPKFGSFPVLKQLDMVKNAIKSGFLKIDNNMRLTSQDTSGCTAICSLISPTHLFIANCGDSRAVLYDGTSLKFVTEDHKPFNPKERKRIIDAGGQATQRINGTLAVSRALGDFEFKKDHRRGPCAQLVSPEPEVTSIERLPQDEFLILACDGIWDVMDNDDLCQFVRHKLLTEPNIEEICSSVLDVCLNKGSRDNMSIIIVVFENGPKVDEMEVEKAKQNDQILIEAAETFLQEAQGLEFNDFVLYCKTQDDFPKSALPPGGGIEAKYDLLRKIFEGSSNATNEKSQ